MNSFDLFKSLNKAEQRRGLEAAAAMRYGLDVSERRFFRPLAGPVFDMSTGDLLSLLSFADLTKCLVHHRAKIQEFLIAELELGQLLAAQMNGDGTNRFILNHACIDLGSDDAHV